MPYTHVQFVGFNIRPGTDTSGPSTTYLGASDARQDMLKRCAIMKAAIQKAFEQVKAAKATSSAVPVARATFEDIKETMHKSTNGVARRIANAIDSTATLRIFMAPEFFFRNQAGAYPIDVVSDIVPELRKETDQDQYKDWLFVFGTAIGYIDQDREVIAQKRDEYRGPVKAVTGGGGSAKVITLEGLPHGDWVGGDLQNADVRTAKIKEMWHYEDRRLHTIVLDQDVKASAENPITLVSVPDPPNEWSMQIERIDPPRRPSETVVVVAAPPETDCSHSSGCPCTTYETLLGQKKLTCKNCKHPHVPWEINDDVRIENVKARAGVVKVTPKGGGKYELELDSDKPFAVNDRVILRQALTKSVVEILNVALVRKGGPATATPGLKEAIVYKEYISSIDYIAPLQGTQAFYRLPEGGRVIELLGKHQLVAATSGSRDTKPGLEGPSNVVGSTVSYTVKKKTDTSTVSQTKTQTISEISPSGLGGGSVFTIDDITFGLEVCLDHGMDRLAEFYRKAKKGDRRAQIHLIPSWGMTIDGGEIACVDGGPIFNVDGDRAGKASPKPPPAEVQVSTGYVCKTHPTVKSAAPANCTDPAGDYCSCSCVDSPHYKIGFLTDPKLIGWKCPDCAGGLVKRSAPLRPAGAPVLPLGPAVDANTAVAAPDWKQYFSHKGSIVVFPKLVIPPAETV